ncbi:hypothetical protein MMC25_000338 [Agyrium rufum]|nr:hypothetical protein [Agyrium rufum]
MSPSVVDNASAGADGGSASRRKRTRVDDGGQPAAQKRKGPRIFAPFRQLGLVSPTEVPFTSIPQGKTTFQITTSTGRCLHSYDLRKGLHLSFITRPQTPATITATAAWKDRVFAAWGGSASSVGAGVWVFKRGKKVAELEMPLGVDEHIQTLMIFGSWIVGCGAKGILIWKSATYEHYTTIQSNSYEDPGSEKAFSGVLCNVPTLLNKILVGKQDGSVEIWNISTGKLIYTIMPTSLDSGVVTALQPSPALSFIAIGRADGSITIHDVCADKAIIALRSSEEQPVTSITFRTDDLGAGEDGRNVGVLATASRHSGDITMWDLNKGGRIMGILRDAHNPPSKAASQNAIGITKIDFLPGQPVIVSTGFDNALRTWIFDESPFSPVPRILHSRSGHAAPVTRLEFVQAEADGADAIGKWMLSASRDQSLWGWSIRRDAQSTELSQGNVQNRARKTGAKLNGLGRERGATLEDLKAPEITCIACCLNRDGGMGASTGGGAVWANVSNSKQQDSSALNGPTGWESVLTGHKGDRYARTWFWGRKKAGRWALETRDGTEVKSVALSPCGTFAVVGSAGGGIDMYNLQSGIHRQRFPSPLTPAQARKLKIQQTSGSRDAVDVRRKYGAGEGKHTRAVTGILVDNLNRLLISCSLDGKIKFWDFHTGLLQHEIDWHTMTSIIGCRHHRSSDLIAFSCDDLSIRVVDMETTKLVRELWGCIGQISDFCFSNDGRWIIAASMDSVVRVWDLPTGHLIDALHLPSMCTALAFSPTGEFLATAHVDSVGINVWTNRTLFTHVPISQLEEGEISYTSAPTASGEDGQTMLEAAFEDEEAADGLILNTNSMTSPIEQLSSSMQTLSVVPRSRWQTLLHLDTIAQRNKPIEPPKAPEKAPFFLPSVSSSQNDREQKTLAISATINRSESDAQASSVAASERPRITLLQKNRSITSSEFTKLLNSTIAGDLQDSTGSITTFIKHLASLSPAAADIEIRSLSPLPIASASSMDLEGESERRLPTELELFVRALTLRLGQKRDFELVQAWMSVFLRVHGEVIVSAMSSSLGETADVNGTVHETHGEVGLEHELRAWREMMRSEASRLGDLVGYCSGVVGFIRSVR